MPRSGKSDAYEACVREAERRYAGGGLRLCPRGYCAAKARYAVYPSAYANGYASQVCRGEQPDGRGVAAADPRYYRASPRRRGDLGRWFDERWVNVCEPGDGPGGYAPCGSGAGVDDPSRYPYCRPYRRLPGTRVVTANELTADERARMCAWKRSLPQGVGGKPTRVRLPGATRARVRRARRAGTRGDTEGTTPTAPRARTKGAVTRGAKRAKRATRTTRRSPQRGGAAATVRVARTRFPWISLAGVESHVPEARRLGVSPVARAAPRGFVAAYRRHRTPRAMGRAPVPGRPHETWARRRANFIKRHLAQYRKNPTARRRLALRMWAYEPALTPPPA